MRFFSILLISGMLCFSMNPLSGMSGIKADNTGNMPALSDSLGKKGPEVEMVVYYFVLLKKGPNRTQPDSVAKEIQKGHMDNINKLAAEGKLIAAGPFGDELGGGIFVLKCASVKEAEEVTAKDPAIIAGRLVAEIRPWWTAKGTFMMDK